jgi:hypothetical protein
VVLGKRACILREAVQEGGPCLFLHVDADRLRIGARHEEQFVDNPVDAGEFLEVAVDQQAFGVQVRLMARWVPFAARLEQEPGPSLSFVDPDLDQAGSRDVAVFLAHVVGFP